MNLGSDKSNMGRVDVMLSEGGIVKRPGTLRKYRLSAKILRTKQNVTYKRREEGDNAWVASRKRSRGVSKGSGDSDGEVAGLESIVLEVSIGAEAHVGVLGQIIRRVRG